MLFTVIKKYAKPADLIIGAALVTMALMTDFDRLWYTDIITLATLALWSGQFALRLFLAYRQEKEKLGK